MSEQKQELPIADSGINQSHTLESEQQTQRSLAHGEIQANDINATNVANNQYIGMMVVWPQRKSLKGEKKPAVVVPQDDLSPGMIHNQPHQQSRAHLYASRTVLSVLAIAIVIGGVFIGMALLFPVGPHHPEKPSSSQQVTSPLYTYRPPSGMVDSIAWSPHGTYLACANGGGTAQLITASDAHYHSTTLYYGHKGPVNDVAWSPDESRIASAGADKTVQIWDPINGATILRYSGHTTSIVNVAWSPDGKRIASSDLGGLVQVWDATTGKSLTTYRGHTGHSVYWVAWSPDSTRIASGSEDQTVQVWNATTGKTLLTYHGHSASVQAAEWSPDGTRIASAGADMTIQVWNAITGKLLSTYLGHTDTVWVIVWSPDGRRIASASADGTARVWQVAQDH